MVNEYRAFWTIPGAGPSLSTFHAQASSGTTAQAFADNVRKFFNAIKGSLPDEVAVSFDTEVTTIDTATGVLSATQAVTPGLPVAGTGTGVWAAGSGARVVWATSRIIAGRRVRGSTFLVPLAANQYSADGTVVATSIVALSAAATTLIADGQASTSELGVYSRPIPGRPGSFTEIETASVPSTVATLRGRKY